jgi:hypothetical protein
MDSNLCEYRASVMDNEPRLGPFEPHILSAIRAAFQVSWNEVARELAADVSYARNRLLGTIAHLATKRIHDPHELKSQALHVLGIGVSALAGGTSHAGRNR